MVTLNLLFKTPVFFKFSMRIYSLFFILNSIFLYFNGLKLFVIKDLLFLSLLFLLFLQDWVMFVGVEKNELVFVTNFFKSDVVLYKGLLVPQAWTLGVELSFYLIAPFILPKRKILATLLFLSIALRMYLIYIGLGLQDPWAYRFFPTELAFFLLGAVSHQFILPFYRNFFSKEKIEKYSIFSTYFLILITLVFWLIPIGEMLKSALLFLGFFILMPLTFLFQSERYWDKWIGDLSYPIYICHILVIYVTGEVMKNLAWPPIAISLTAVVFSICLAIALNAYIGKPIEALRNRLRNVN